MRVLEAFNCGSFSKDTKKLAKLGSNTGQLIMSLINDILDLLQIEANKFKISLNQFSPEDTIKECLAIMKLQFERKGLMLNYAPKEKLPKYVVNDKNRYKQVILNLLRNAFKFTIKGQVVVSARYEESMLITKVKDTRTGMKCGKSVDLFSLYEKLDSNMKVNCSGAGLGLPIYKKLTGTMGGSIRIKSMLNKGTTIKFSIEDKKAQNAVNEQNDTIADTEELLDIEGNECSSPRIRKSITVSATNTYKEYWRIKEVMKVLVMNDDYNCVFAIQNYFKSRRMVYDLEFTK
jgi:K+-sensing histidine kinase KdpD